MTTVITRSGKGSSLSWVEMDANFNNLNADKLEADTPGTNIANTPAGNIVSVTVQAAINELDIGKAPIASPTFTGNPTAPTPTAGDNDTSIATTEFVTSAIIGIAGKNKLFNPLGTINQRGYVSGAATSGANQYTLDRWRVVTSGQNLTFSISGLVTTMTAPAGGLEQVIESNNIVGGVYTLNWTGTATATVNGSVITKGSQTSSLTANTDVTIRFSNGTVSQPQFELGTLATQFESRPHPIELLLCQRYYERLGGNVGTGAGSIYHSAYCVATNSFAMSLSYKVPKRSLPNISKKGTWYVTNCAQPMLTGGGLDGCAIYAVATTSAMALFQSVDSTTYVEVEKEL